MNPPYRSYPLVLRLVLLFFLFLFNIAVVYFIAVAMVPTLFGIDDTATMLAGNLEGPNEMHAFLFIKGVSSFGGFILTPLMFSVLEAGEFKRHLRLTTALPLKLLLLGVVSVLVAQGFVDFLVRVMQHIHLPPALQSLYDSQKRAEELTNAIMNFKDVGNLLLVSFVVALIPAIGEEFFFRGLLLGDLLREKVNPWVAIPVTGLIFAISHFEFDNTLAIFALGSFLGYLYYISGSIWLPVAAHFTNNFMAVLLRYLYNLGYISEDLANAHTPFYITLLAIAIFAALIFVFNKWKKAPTFVEIHEPLS